MSSKPRTGIPGVKGLSGVVNETAWGVATAVSRYGDSKYIMGRGAPPPKDQSQPQDPMDKPSDRSFNDIPQNSWRYDGSGRKPRGWEEFTQIPDLTGAANRSLSLSEIVLLYVRGQTRQRLLLAIPRTTPGYAAETERFTRSLISSGQADDDLER
jgi:hypothetical protein